MSNEEILQQPKNKRTRKKRLNAQQTEDAVKKMAAKKNFRSQYYSDPKSVQEHYRNPVVRASFEKAFGGPPNIHKLNSMITQKLIQLQTQGDVLDQKDLTLYKEMLAADDFGDGLKNLLTKAKPVVTKHILPILRNYFPAMAPVLNHFSSIMETRADAGVRMNRTIMLANFTTLSDQLQIFELNPALRHFGWISQVARAYQYYHVHSFTVRFSTGAALNNNGILKYYINYDSDAEPTNYQDLDNQAQLQLTPVFKSHEYKWDEEALHLRFQKYKIRSSLPPGVTEYTSTTAQAYDFGKLIIAHNSSTAAIGIIEVDLDVEFFMPVADVAIDLNNVHAYEACTTQFFTTIASGPFEDSGYSYDFSNEVANLSRVALTGTYTFFVTNSGTAYSSGIAPVTFKTFTVPGTLPMSENFTVIADGYNYSISGFRQFAAAITVNLRVGQFFAIVKSTSSIFPIQGTKINAYLGTFNIPNPAQLSQENTAQMKGVLSKIKLLEQELRYYEKYLPQRKTLQNEKSDSESDIISVSQERQKKGVKG